MNESDFSLFIQSLDFAARRHSGQRRKDAAASPYINHPIEVARVLWEEGDVRDPVLLAAAILHDTVEDTETTDAELRNLFGSQVAGVVAEVTDDKRLPKDERKRLQVEHAPHLSLRARQLKTADLICNVHGFIDSPPAKWPLSRQRGYLDWAEQVFGGCCGSNPALDSLFRQTLSVVREALLRRSDPQ